MTETQSFLSRERCREPHFARVPLTLAHLLLFHRRLDGYLHTTRARVPVKIRCESEHGDCDGVVHAWVAQKLLECNEIKSFVVNRGAMAARDRFAAAVRAAVQIRRCQSHSWGVRAHFRSEASPLKSEMEVKILHFPTCVLPSEKDLGLIGSALRYVVCAPRSPTSAYLYFLPPPSPTSKLLSLPIPHSIRNLPPAQDDA